MNIEDLRVGNVVIGIRHNLKTLEEERHIIKIQSVFRYVARADHQVEWVKDEDSYVYSLKALCEIDLNSKWLLKMGFKKVAGSSMYKYWHNRLSIVFDYSDNTLTIMQHSRTIFEKYVDYVHEMQNVLRMFEIEIPV